MTLIIDMASGTRLDEPTRTAACGEAAPQPPLLAPTAAGLAIEAVTPTHPATAMPRALCTCNLEVFLDTMS